MAHPAELGRRCRLRRHRGRSRGTAGAAARPELIAPPGTDPSARFYPTMYAARAVPFGLLVTAVCWLASAYPLTPFILAVAALAQFGDAVIGGLRRLPGMAAGAALAGVCHAVGAIVLF